jgi:DNA repair exonuclease SbcCD ATPase subunit
MDIDGLGTLLLEKEKQTERRVGEARHIAHRGKEVAQEIADLEALHSALDEAIGVLNSYADSRQVELQRRIETLLTHGLQTIFGADMSFHIKQGKQGAHMTSDFLVRSKIGGDTIDTPIMDARGGGVAAVAGFLLRLIILLLKPNARPVMFLDETFAQLSAEYEPVLAEFMRELIEKTHVQIVMVTHSNAYSDVADKQYRFALEDGITKISAEV